MKDVLANPTLPWRYLYLSMNPSITMKDMIENPAIPWNYAELSGHPSGIPKHKGVVAMEKEARERTIARTRDPQGRADGNRLEPDRICQILQQNSANQWNHEERAYTVLDWNTMAEVF
jgi:hypothetical protein